MVCMNRNKSAFFFALYVSKEQGTDDYGNPTGGVDVSQKKSSCSLDIHLAYGDRHAVKASCDLLHDVVMCDVEDECSSLRRVQGGIADGLYEQKQVGVLFRPLCKQGAGLRHLTLGPSLIEKVSGDFALQSFVLNRDFYHIGVIGIGFR